MNRVILVIAVIVISILGTACTGDTSLDAVFVVDGSQSILQVSRERLIQSIKNAVRIHGDDGDHIARNSLVTVIPISNMASIDGLTNVIRVRTDTPREPYDMDLQRAEETLGRELDKLNILLRDQPSQDSDFIGTIELASDEFQHRHSDSKALIILSDFLHDVRRGDVLRFVDCTQLKNPVDARKFAKQLAGKTPHKLQNVAVFLGMLTSSDFVKLNQARQDAVVAFAAEYFNDLGASSVEFSIDGLGHIEDFMVKVRSGHRSNEQVGNAKS